MSQAIGTGRWDTEGDETKPFGMPFVDLVASALICVIALLIVWLQFIDPLGIVPGRGHREGAASQGMQGRSSLDDAIHGGPRLNLLTAVAIAWKLDGKVHSPAVVTVSCRSGQKHSSNLAPSIAGTATASFRFDTGVEDCVVEVKAEGVVESPMEITVQSIAEGRHFYQANHRLQDPGRSWRHAIIADGDERKVRRALGLKEREPWTFAWGVK
ncbi:hypothetical protein [Mesorhizobium sp.]|uniref:hypothetical protein n=1 Tax=Mesorhizobium sp. TaxID=1871066 RepID=UPI000FE6EC41|nr:hypothetical protein [Mesorhizobium sp.]RWP13900.1 MAG: hypothetical protein EOQ97_02920 [Mesorhizobium sp.]